MRCLVCLCLFVFAVLSESTSNSVKNPVYEKARELHYKAWKLKEDLLKERDDNKSIGE